MCIKYYWLKYQCSGSSKTCHFELTFREKKPANFRDPCFLWTGARPHAHTAHIGVVQSNYLAPPPHTYFLEGFRHHYKRGAISRPPDTGIDVASGTGARPLTQSQIKGHICQQNSKTVINNCFIIYFYTTTHTQSTCGCKHTVCTEHSTGSICLTWKCPFLLSWYVCYKSHKKSIFLSHKFII